MKMNWSKQEILFTAYISRKSTEGRTVRRRFTQKCLRVKGVTRRTGEVRHVRWVTQVVTVTVVWVHHLAGGGAVDLAGVAEVVADGGVAHTTAHYVVKISSLSRTLLEQCAAVLKTDIKVPTNIRVSHHCAWSSVKCGNNYDTYT